MELVRKFKIIVNSKECGTCSGPTPSSVAKKVVKKLCGTSSKAVRFSLKECKRGCERVCGPYQGRMEKLDRPYKRDGKTITHRVVCEKVRKMRGGLNKSDFIKKDDDGDFRITYIFFRPYIFFGVSEDGKSYKYSIVADHFGQNIDYFFKNNHIDNTDFFHELIELKKYLDDSRNIPKNKFKRIRHKIDEYLEFLKKYDRILSSNKCKRFIYKDDFSSIFLYEDTSGSALKLKYIIQANTLINNSGERFSIFKNNTQQEYNMKIKNLVSTTDFCHFLKEQNWIYMFNGRDYIQKGKLVDIIQNKDLEIKESLINALKKLHSMCFPLLEPFNLITTN